MISSSDGDKKRLPKADFILLPALFILTMLFCLGSSELTARHFFYGQEIDSCQVKDANVGVRFKPNCTSRTKTDEGPWVVNHYNDCGYRTKEPCQPKRPGTIRIALIGSSVAQGWSTPYEQTFAARASAELTSRCRRPVEIQNLGRENCSVACMFHRVDEALSLDPDVLLVAISPFDIETTSQVDVDNRYKPMSTGPTLAEVQQKQLPIKRLEKLITGSRTVVAAEHFIFQDPSTYLRMYLAYGDKADFLRSPLSAAWERRLQNVDLLLHEMAIKAAAAHVRMVVVEVPNLPQVSALNLASPPSGIDPYLLNERLSAIASSPGLQFVDVLNTFKKTPHSNTFFYLTAGHLNGKGYSLVSTPLVKALTTGSHPPIQGCTVATSGLQN